MHTEASAQRLSARATCCTLRPPCAPLPASAAHHPPTRLAPLHSPQVRDLLSRDNTKKMELKESPDRGVYVKDLSQFVCKNFDEMTTVLKVGGGGGGRAGGGGGGCRGRGRVVREAPANGRPGSEVGAGQGGGRSPCWGSAPMPQKGAQDRMAAAAAPCLLWLGCRAWAPCATRCCRLIARRRARTTV